MTSVAILQIPQAIDDTLRRATKRIDCTPEQLTMIALADILIEIHDLEPPTGFGGRYREMVEGDELSQDGAV